MRHSNQTVRKAVAAVLFLHLVACMFIAVGCWLKPAQSSAGHHAQASAVGKPATRAVVQRAKSSKPMPFGHSGNCFLRPRKN